MKVLSPRTDDNEFNVRAYGALGDGSADEQVAFQAAADAAEAYAATNGQAVLRIPSGEYRLDSPFRVIGGKVTILAYGAYVFAGSNSDLFRDWTAQDSSYTLNGSGLQVLGGTWDLKGQNWGLQSNATMDAAGYSAFTLSNSSNILFRDLTIRNCYAFHAIDINTCDGVFMDNVRCEGFRNNFEFKTDVVAATTANRTLSGLTNTSLDGVTPTASQRVLVKNQTNPIENGIYAAASGAWTRVTDMDAAGEASRAAVLVTGGTTLDNTVWYVSSDNPTPGTHSMVWAQATGFNTQSRYFSEAIQLDDGPNDIPCKNVTLQNCWMGPASDGSGLGSYGKMVGSHTDSTNGLYENIKVQGCTSVDSLSNAIQGYSWADATISDNTILGSAERGIRMTFNASNVGPRLSITGNMISETVHHGIEIDGATGTFGDVNVSNNVITSAVMVDPGTGIRIDTIDRVTVSNNSIKLTGSPSAQQGIYLTTISGGICANNGIYDAGTYGIQTTALTRMSLTGNHIYACGSDGIYLTSATTKTICSGNSIVGAGRTTNATYSGITVSNNAGNIDNSIIGNKFNKYGSGNEAKTPIEIEGTNPTDTYIIGNTFGGDWGGPGLGNYTWNNNASVNLSGDIFITRATSNTSIGTSSGSPTAIAGLSIANVPAGSWKLYICVPLTTVGSPSDHYFQISPSGGPTLNTARIWGYTNRHASSTGMAHLTNFAANSGTLGVLSAVSTLFEVSGSFLSTNTGTISLSMYRTSGTSVTANSGAYIQLTKID